MSVNVIIVKDNFIKEDNIKFAGGDLYVVCMAMTIALVLDIIQGRYR